MAGNAKPKKKYRPRPVLRDPVAHVVAGLSPTSDATRTNLMLGAHLALQAFQRGRAVRDDWDRLATLLNVSLVLAEQGLGAGFKEDVRAAQEAHARCGQRKMVKGNFGYTGEELGQLGYALDIHDAQLQAATVAQIERALDELERRLKGERPALFVNPVSPVSPSSPPSHSPWVDSSVSAT